ncbi:gliding motility-associated C-terminal domain-containing protein [Pinibacter soli]|uniref:Gliding motility-associated C-terminal domain-containing protein n=1 Tax=Pinibacter soli TaxID=3044211 RepID=A0ABT6RCU7_9BACT|nr:gliding motility-associated C-terminal domain-containing protein [Pinibacter soli]MDI3320403.1 gliding motility-associated C-terminal domain-containing protein [Pinibacter soli]
MKRLFLLCILIAFFSSQIFAQQLCSGSLGDPVVNITFGSGATNPGPALDPSVTFYTFWGNNSCPNDGLYTISNSIVSCFGDSWHTLTNHTPNDPNGYMMVVNASLQHGDFYKQTVTGLCGNTTYEFAAWVVNILRQSACGGPGSQQEPNLTFSIETTTGTVLSTYSTGKIPSTTSPVWKQYGLFFQTPANVSQVVIRMTNNADGGCGNDIALDDITFRACGPMLNAGDATTHTPSVNQCENALAPVQLQATVTSGYSNPTYQWQKSADNGATWSDIPGATTTTLNFTPTGKGVVLYRIVSAELGNINSTACRIVSNVVTVTVNAIPPTGIGSNSPVCDNNTIKLSANAGKAFAWAGPNSFTSTDQNPTLTAHTVSAGTYKLTYTDNNSCTNTGSVDVVVNPLPVINAGQDVAICNGESTNLQASGGANYVWSPPTALSNTGVANPVASPTQTITYRVSASDANGCIGSDDVIVTVWKNPTANAGPDRKILQGQFITLNGQASGDDISYSWQPATDISGESTLQPTVNPAKDVSYTLVVTSAHNCPTATDDVFVKVFKKLLIPNAFSPNNDGANDYWRLESLQVYPTSTVKVYNRFGQCVYSAIGAESPVWDGKYQGNLCPMGGYSYVIDLKNGTPILTGMLFIVL